MQTWAFGGVGIHSTQMWGGGLIHIHALPPPPDSAPPPSPLNRRGIDGGGRGPSHISKTLACARAFSPSAGQPPASGRVFGTSERRWRQMRGDGEQ